MSFKKQRVFRFALLTENTARAATVICDAAPTFQTDSDRVATFLSEFPQVTVKRIAQRPDDAPDGQIVLQYVSRKYGKWFVVVKGGLPTSLKDATLKRRLNDEFVLRRPIIPLRNQATLIDFFGEMDWSHDALAAPFFTFWEMGSGKTLAMLLATLGSNRPPRGILVVCSNTLVGHWMETAMRVHMKAPSVECVDKAPYHEVTTVVRIVGFTHFKMNAEELMRGMDVAIVDECQEFRSYTKDQRMAVQELQHAKSLFLLSGTPLVNSSQDMMGLLALMGERIHDVSTNRARWTMQNGRTVTVTGPEWRWPTEPVKKLFHHNVSFYVPRLHASVDFQSMFPKIERHTVSIPLSLQQTLKYLVVRGRLAAPAPSGWTGAQRSLVFKTPTGNFYNNRQVEACNEADVLTELVPKAQWVVQHLSKDSYARRDLPMVVHSNFIHKGIRLIQTALRDAPATRHLRMAEIVGDVAARKRDTIISSFNEGKVDVLFISKAASTGVSLQGARSFVIEEAFPNVSSEEQTIGRVIRADSHPEGHAATVRVFKLTATFPPSLKRADIATQSKVSMTELGEWFEEEASALWPRAITKLRKLLTTPSMWTSWLTQVVHAGMKEEGFQTVNELFEARNQEKAQALAVYVNILRQSSITMPMGTMKFKLPSRFLGMSDASRLAACKRAMKEKLAAIRPSWLKVNARWTMCINTAFRRVFESAPDAWLEMNPTHLVSDSAFGEALIVQLGFMVYKEEKRLKAKQLAAVEKRARAKAREDKARVRAQEELKRQQRRRERELEWARKRQEKEAKRKAWEKVKLERQQKREAKEAAKAERKRKREKKITSPKRTTKKVRRKKAIARIHLV